MLVQEESEEEIHKKAIEALRQEAKKDEEIITFKTRGERASKKT